MPHDAFSGGPAAIHYGEAVERITQAAANKATELELDALGALERLPPSISKLSHLQRLSLSGTRVKSLAPLKKLVRLQSLSVDRTPVRNIAHVGGLLGLQKFTLRGTRVQDISPLANLLNLRSLDLDLTAVTDLVPLAKLRKLQVLKLSRTKVSDLSPLANLFELRSVDLQATKAVDLSPLSGLTKLQQLDLQNTGVVSLGPLADLRALKGLNLKSTAVRDIEALSELHNLEELELGFAPVTDISPLAELRKLTFLILDGSRVGSLAPLQKLQNLYVLAAKATAISGLEAVSELTNLLYLDVSLTSVRDLQPIAALSELKHLDVSHTRVADLSPLSALSKLESLHLNGSQVRDASSLAKLTGLADGLLGKQEESPNGLWFAETPLARVPPFNSLARRKQPTRTVETINAVRRQIGMPDHLPDGYRRPKGIDALLGFVGPDLGQPNLFQQLVGKDEDEAEEEQSEDDEATNEAFRQRPASYSFTWQNERIAAEPQSGSPRNGEIASDFRNEILAKAASTRERAAKSNAPARVLRSIDWLVSALGKETGDVRPGVLQMRFRSLAADVDAFSTDHGRREIGEEILAMLRDLADSTSDLLACYPEIAAIEAERISQRLQENDIQTVIQSLKEIELAAATVPELVDESAVHALTIGDEQIREATNTIRRADQSGRFWEAAEAAQGRAKIVGQKLLDYGNFSAAVLRHASHETGRFGADVLKRSREPAVNAVSEELVRAVKFGTRGALAIVLSSMLHPLAGLAVLLPRFKRQHEKANEVVKAIEAPSEPRGSAPDAPSEPVFTTPDPVKLKATGVVDAGNVRRQRRGKSPS